jgi:hypothetical protein
MAQRKNETDVVAADDESGLSRRTLLKLGTGAALGTALTGLNVEAGIESAQNKPAVFFTRDEFELVDELTELIIPADEHSPGARAANVAAYIDFRLSESLEDGPKTQWRAGLKLIEQLSREMHGKSFLAATVEQRIALLTRISQNEEKAAKPEELFFKELKSRTVNAYYTSKIGIHTEMEYKGNTYLKEFAGHDAT